MHELIAGEREARETGALEHSAGFESLRSSTRSMALKSVESLNEQVEALRTEFAQEADILELRQIVGSEKLEHAEHHKSVHELIASEREAREKIWRDIQTNHDVHRGEVW